jgi:hypothetical protein
VTPSGTRGAEPGQIVKQYAWDAPRFAAEPGKGAKYSFSGNWELEIRDTENAWGIKFRITFNFDDEHPERGSGQLTITEEAHELKR